MRILFTTPVLEHPAAGGPQLRIENSIKALNSLSELHVISQVPKKRLGGNNAEEFFKSICFEFTYIPSAKRALLTRVLKKIYSVLNKYFKFKNSNKKEIFIESNVNFILKYLIKHNINIIWFGYGNISYHLIKQIKQRRPEVKIVCDTDSVWSRFILRELPYEESEKRREEIKALGYKKELEEAEWVNLCEITTAVSEVDAEYYRELTKFPERIKIFSNVIDLANYQNRPIPPDDFKTPCMFLAGTFGPKSPMDKAARWVIEKVLPLVRQEIPNVHFYIVGNGSDFTLTDIKDPDITITGKLSSVLPYLCNSNVALVPLMFESGTRFKIMEAGTCRIPIVSTTLGAEGLNVINNRDILIADEPANFARSIVNLINNKELSKIISENCFKLIQEKCSIEQLIKEGQEIIERLTNGSI